MPCEYAQEQLYLYLDGELAPQEAQAVERHLQGCASCQQAVAAHRRLQAMLRAAFEEEDMSAQLWPAIQQRLAQEVVCGGVWPGVRPPGRDAGLAPAAVHVGIVRFLIEKEGRVAYHGGAGPRFFDLDEWEQA